MSDNGTLERLEKMDMRERIAIMAYESVKSGAIRLSAFNAECDAIYGWIIGKPVQSAGERLISSAKKELRRSDLFGIYPAKKDTRINTKIKRALKKLKGKRKYTKKSKYWAKKKSA